MAKYRNIHTGKITEWTARPDLGVMEREDGERWSMKAFRDPPSPGFFECHELTSDTPAPAPVTGTVGGGGNGREEGEE